MLRRGYLYYVYSSIYTYETSHESIPLTQEHDYIGEFHMATKKQIYNHMKTSEQHKQEVKYYGARFMTGILMIAENWNLNSRLKENGLVFQP